LDTGTGDCLLDADFARRAGVKLGHFDQVSYAGGRTGHLQLARVDQLSIGESRFDRLPAIIAPLGGRFRHDFVDTSIDGTIGAGVLRAAGGIDIDYGRSRFCLGSPGVRQGQPLWIGGSHYPLILCRVDSGPPSSWFVDTGMSGIDLACSPGAARRYGAEPLSEAERRVDDERGTLPANVVRLRRFQHAELTDPSVPAALLKDFALGRELGIRIGGIIGHQWLAKHRVQLDYRAMQTRISAVGTA
jgi:predicted aspartyl protease